MSSAAQYLKDPFGLNLTKKRGPPRTGRTLVCLSFRQKRYYPPSYRPKTGFCNHCQPKHGSGHKVRRARVGAMLRAPKTRDMACIASAVGLTRERVRQIARDEGIDRFTNRSKHFSWPCPGCGALVNRMLSHIKKMKQPALCSACLRGNERFCVNGHENPRRGKNGDCLDCGHERNNKIVRYRICQDCGKVLPVTYNHEQNARVRGKPLMRCLSCYYARKKAQRLPALRPAAMGAAATADDVVRRPEDFRELDAGSARSIGSRGEKVKARAFRASSPAHPGQRG